MSPHRSFLLALLAVPFHLAASPASAQTVETFVLSVGGLSMGPGCSTFTTPAPVLAFFGVRGIAMPVPGYTPCSIAGDVTDQAQPSGPLADSSSLGSDWTIHSFPAYGGRMP